jgi:DNA-directed RNA polymerase specialized sigma24 family protein
MAAGWRFSSIRHDGCGGDSIPIRDHVACVDHAAGQHKRRHQTQLAVFHCINLPLREVLGKWWTRPASGSASDNSSSASFRAINPRKAKIVELRYFGGLSVEETAAVIKVSVETVTRDWRPTRGWLLLEIRGAGRSGESG